MLYRARHILVQYEYEAQDIKKLLDTGKAFETLAMTYSKCPSASTGGDLGTFKSGRMDSDFEEALSLLKIGEISKPIRTKFGYHLIKRESVD